LPRTPTNPRSSRLTPALNLISKAILPDGIGISTEGNEGNKVEKPLLAPSAPLCGHFKIVFHVVPAVLVMDLSTVDADDELNP